MAVLRARLSLLQGNASYALAAAQALARQEVIGREEQANAWRVAAAAAESLARPEEALQYFQAALEIDRSLALSTRIAEDLNGLARVNRTLGRADEAAAYARRAELVSDAERKRKGTAR
jgi:tetratricopeptide (TPR) repeat protein